MKNLLLSLFLLGLGWNVFAQDRPISGRVTGDDTQPIPGASVSVKGTTRGAVTNAEGRFTLSVPENAILVVSSVGYLTREFPVGNQNSLELVIPSSSAELSEVVVVGYGTQKKSQLTGAISSVSSKEIAELPITNARQALQGRAAGVDVVQSGSRPGAGVTVRIRGRRSINASNDPLYVVDGIPLAGGIDDLNPNDIQSMEVLKDASATAIYGSRGANGVVIVSTRRGTTGKTIVSYDGYYGISQVLGKIDVMNGAEFAEYKRESRRTSGRYNDSDPAADSKIFEAVELDGIANNRTTDYQSYIFRTGQIQSHQLGVQGGSEKTQFAISGNFFQDKGIIKTQDFTRYSFRINLDHQITKRIKVGTSTFAVYSVANGNDTFYPGGGNGFNPLGLTLRENPLGKPYDDNGNLIFLPTSDGLQSNPAAEVVPGSNIAETKTIRIFNSLYGEWNIIDGLKYRLNFGPDFTNRRFGRFWGTYTSDRRGGDPRGLTDYSQGFNYTLENILTYQKQFREVHDLNITALHSIQRDNYETARINVNGIPASTQEFYSLGQASTIAGVGTGLTQWTLLSFMGRVNYSYNDKYLITVTGRYDGSSRFGRNNKFGFFPSLAVGWNMSNEAFLKGVSWLDQLKLRGSWGSIGNTAIDPYQTQNLLSRTVYAWNTIGAYGYRPNVLGNPNLRWETTTTANVGLDYSFFRGRIAGSLEVYQADTKDLLLADQLPFTSGYGSVLRNVGKTRNQGLEITLSTINIDAANGFRWSTDLQFTKNKEQIRELFNGKVDDVGNARFIGQPITAIYDFKKIGIWQTSESEEAKRYGQNPGEVKLLDISGKDGVPDGKIDATYDRMIIGSQIPKFTAGMTNRFSFKGVDLSFFLYARVGSTITSGFHQTFNTLAGRYNNLDIDYWTPNNPTNEFPRPNQNQESPLYASTLRYFSGTFVKVRNINVGYNFTEGIARKLGMSSLRAYVAAQQPFIFSEYRSKYKGIDNETVNNVDENQTPSARQFIFGINAKF